MPAILHKVSSAARQMFWPPVGAYWFIGRRSGRMKKGFYRGRLFFSDFLLATQKKVASSRAAPGEVDLNT
ncbi:MAG: hypothetical protein PHP85_03930 [Gallionella sp.]|nr:hypothetical protein [Gallionella sp.]